MQKLYQKFSRKQFKNNSNKKKQEKESKKWFILGLRTKQIAPEKRNIWLKFFIFTFYRGQQLAKYSYLSCQR